MTEIHFRHNILFTELRFMLQLFRLSVSAVHVCGSYAEFPLLQLIKRHDSNDLVILATYRTSMRHLNTGAIVC